MENEINEEENEEVIEHKEIQPEPAEKLKEIVAEDEKNIRDKIDADHKKSEKITKCSVCSETFETRNKLFDHIKKEGHAALKTNEPTLPMSHNATKRNKRLNKNKK